MSTFVLTEAHEGILRHMLGAGSDVPKKTWGYRNRYCTGLNSGPHKLLLEMQEAGLVKPGAVINQGKVQVFYATREGCLAIGFKAAQIKRALED